MGFRAPGLLRIPQWSIVNRLVTAEDITFDINGVETTRLRTDLTGGIVYLTVRDATGAVVIQKDSTDTTEIEIKNQGVDSLKGQATIKFVEADTAPLSTTAVYWFDVWAKTSDGREEPIVDNGRFFVDKSQTHISEGPVPDLPTFPASQTPQLQNWKWTAPSTGDTFTVTLPIPTNDAVYTVNSDISTIPAGGANTLLHCADAQRTTTQLQLTTAAPILIGTVVDFLVRDAT